MKNTIKNFIDKMTVNFTILFNSKAVREIIKNFTIINNGLFVGIREYQTKMNEIANHVVKVNFSYMNAVNKDIEKLQNITQKDISNISLQFGVDVDLVNKAIEKLLTSFINNQNKETQSNQSKAQKDIYIPVCPSIKMHRDTKNFHIYALAVSKEVIIKGEYNEVNHRPLTIAQNAVKKYLDFTTAKFRNFIVSPENLSAVAMNKNIIELL
jgi:hypothetical protein